MSLDYIRTYYRVPAKKGGRVRFRGKPGTIIGARDAGLIVRLDGEKVPVPLHPTWEVEYADENGPATRVPATPLAAAPAGLLADLGEPLWSGV